MLAFQEDQKVKVFDAESWESMQEIKFCSNYGKFDCECDFKLGVFDTECAADMDEKLQIKTKK